MAKFEIGKTYFTRSIGDADCIITLEVISRTAKTIKGRTDRGVQTFRVSEYDGVEQVKPWAPTQWPRSWAPIGSGPNSREILYGGLGIVVALFLFSLWKLCDSTFPPKKKED
jgi:hypothetical protein